MIDFIIEVLKGLGLAFVISNFAPLSWILDILKNNLFKYILVLLTSCWACCTFWTTLILFGLWPAVTAYVIAYFLMEIKEIINRKYINKI